MRVPSTSYRPEAIIGMGIVLVGAVVFGKVVIDDLVDYQQSKARGSLPAPPPKTQPKGAEQLVQLGIKAVGIYVTWLEFRPWMSELEKFLVKP